MIRVKEKTQIQKETLNVIARCDERFTHAFTACGCVFKEITLIGSNQGNYFENATACSKRTLKTTVATQLYFKFSKNADLKSISCNAPKYHAIVK